MTKDEQKQVHRRYITFVFHWHLSSFIYPSTRCCVRNLAHGCRLL